MCGRMCYRITFGIGNIPKRIVEKCRSYNIKDHIICDWYTDIIDHKIRFNKSYTNDDISDLIIEKHDLKFGKVVFETN